MNDADSDFSETMPCEGSQDLNGKDASFRNASMISPPRTVVKQRLRGALVPLKRVQ